MRFAPIAAAALLFCSPAAASHCPQDMKSIDRALARNPRLTDAELTEVKRLRAEGERMHREGKHDDALDRLGKAMRILGLNHTHKK